jgi:hypothetical protein
MSWDTVDKHKCDAAFQEVIGNLREVDEEDAQGRTFGALLTDKEIGVLRKELGKDHGLNGKEAEFVLAAIRKEFPPSSTSAEAPITEAPTTEAGDWIPTPKWPGYAVDTHARLMALKGGQGRKAGKIIALTRVWVDKNGAKNKGSKGKPLSPLWRFRMYYQITVNGKSVKIPYYDVGIARNRLEGKARYGG